MGTPAPALDMAHVSLLLAIVLIAAKVGSEAAVRMKQPPVLGELAVGLILGNVAWGPLAGIAHDASIDVLAEIGVLVLLFEVGLESTVRDVLSVGSAALKVAVLGTLGTLLAGFALTTLAVPSTSLATRAFLAASITATSVGITARVLKDLGQSRSAEARTILGAAVADDIIGLLVLALASGVIAAHAAGRAVSSVALLVVVAKTVGFLAGAVILGTKVTPLVFKAAAGLRSGGVLLATGLALCFFSAWAAGTMGLAPIVGAFAAGLVLEDLHSARFVARGEQSLAQRVEPISELLVPVFFVVMGMRADLRVLVHPHTLLLTAVLAVAAIAGKLACVVGAGAGKSRLTVAIGMVPRGEVSLVFASLGSTLVVDGAPVLEKNAYSAIVAVVALTTLVTPPALTWSFRRSRGMITRAEGGA